MNPVLYHGTSTKFDEFRYNRPSLRHDEAVYLAFSPYKALSHAGREGYVAEVEVLVPPERWVDITLKNSEYPEWLATTIPFNGLHAHNFEDWYNASCKADPSLFRKLLCYCGIYAIQSFDDVSPTSNRHELRILSTSAIKITKWFQCGKKYDRDFIDPDTGTTLIEYQEIIQKDKENLPSKYR